tara:strand:- start:195 stop:974 length:780 start_codon:yes stop_codon:yes gene_type:complete
MTQVTIKKKIHKNINVNENYIATTKCSTGNCSNVCNLANRKYKSYVRVPLKGYRRTLNCNNSSNNNCYTYQQVFRDTYSNATDITCPTNSTSGNFSRTNKPIIKSGLMPNKNGTSKHDDIKFKYAYSYSERMKNIKKNTYKNNLPSNSSGTNHGCVNGKKICEDGNGTVIQNYNNKYFFQQGAVSSSTRLERLKLNAMKKSCDDTNNSCNDNCCYDKSLFINRIVGPKDIFGNSPCPGNKNVYNNALFKARGTIQNNCT